MKIKDTLIIIAIMFFVIWIVGGLILFAIDYTDKRSLCAEKLNINSVWGGYETNPSYHYLGNGNLACCIGESWVDDEGAFHKERCLEFAVDEENVK